MNRTPSALLPPRVEITSAKAYTGAGVSDLPNNGGTQYNNAHFIFRAIPYNPSLPVSSVSSATFECRWDSPNWSRCGSPIPNTYCNVRQVGGVVRVESCRVIDTINGLLSMNNIPEGWHQLFIRAKNPDSIPGPETPFIWCVRGPSDRCITDTSSPDWRPITASHIGLGGMLPETGLNDSLIIPDAGLKNITIENEKAKLSGQIITVNSGTPGNETKAPDIKSLSWKQIEGPEVKLNSTESQNVEFLAPSVENDTLLKFNFTVTDSKGINSTDTTSLFLVTKENAQNYNGTFCDAMVTKALEQTNLANMTLGGKGEYNNNSNNKTSSHMEQAKKYLTECEGPLNQYAKQLVNITEIFPNLNMTSTTSNVTNITLQLQTQDLGQVPIAIKNSSVE